MAKAAAGGGGPDLLMLAAVGAMAFLALRSRAAVAGTGVPVNTVAQLRPDYTAQRNIAYTQAGIGLLGMIFGSGSPDTTFGGQGAGVLGRFGGTGYDVANFNSGYGALEEAMSGFTDKEIGGMNGAYGFGSLVQYPGFGG